MGRARGREDGKEKGERANIGEEEKREKVRVENSIPERSMIEE